MAGEKKKVLEKNLQMIQKVLDFASDDLETTKVDGDIVAMNACLELIKSLRTTKERIVGYINKDSSH